MRRVGSSFHNLSFAAPKVVVSSVLQSALTMDIQDQATAALAEIAAVERRKLGGLGTTPLHVSCFAAWSVAGHSAMLHASRRAAYHAAPPALPRPPTVKLSGLKLSHHRFRPDARAHAKATTLDRNFLASRLLILLQGSPLSSSPSRATIPSSINRPPRSVVVRMQHADAM